MKLQPPGSKQRRARRAFEGACELAVDPGLIGHALRQFASTTSPLGPAGDPLWLLREADRWPNPWEFLLGVRDVPENYRKVFRAADSQRYALTRFCRKAQGVGSLITSWYDRLVAGRASGNNGEVTRAASKILGGMYRTDRGHFLLRAAEGRPAFLPQLQSAFDEFYVRDVRRLGRSRADAKPRRLGTADCFRTYVACDRITFTMACGWLRGDLRGFPGLCFCSDEVISELVGKLLNLTINPGTVRKLRQRLCLKKAVVLVGMFRIRGGGVLELSDSSGRAIWRSKAGP